MREKIKEDELDLWALLISLIHLVRRYLLIIIVFTALGAGAGWLYFNATPEYYKSRMVAESATLLDAEAITIMHSLQNLIGKGDYKAVAQRVKLDSAVIRNVRQITVKKLDNSEKNKTSFYVEAEVYNPDVFDSLGTGLIEFLNNNDYVRKRIAIRQRNREMMKKRITAEIADLDTMKASVKELLQSRGQVSSNFLSDPAAINSRIVELYERLLNIEQAIQLDTEDTRMVAGFTKPSKPDGPQKTLYIVTGLLLGLIFSVVVIIVLLIREKLTKKPVNQVI